MKTFTIPNYVLIKKMHSRVFRKKQSLIDKNNIINIMITVHILKFYFHFRITSNENIRSAFDDTDLNNGITGKNKLFKKGIFSQTNIELKT